MIYDDFQIGASIISGFTFNDYIDDNGENSQNYLSTYWQVFAADPLTGPTPIASGTSVATLTAGSAGSTLFTVTGLNISLGAGTYWLGIGNNVGANTLTDRAYSTSSVLIGFEQGAVGGIPFNTAPTAPGTYGYEHMEFNSAFTVEGTGAGTPEPGTLGTAVIALSGMFAIRFARTRRLSRAKTVTD